MPDIEIDDSVSDSFLDNNTWKSAIGQFNDGVNEIENEIIDHLRAKLLAASNDPVTVINLTIFL